MAVVTIATLKTYFETGDFPTQAQFVDLIDTLSQSIPASGTNNLTTIEYTVGVAGVSGVDHNFTSVANTSEQSIQLGSTTIIPANSIPFIVAKCTNGLNGGITGAVQIGHTAGGTEYLANTFLDGTDEIVYANTGIVGSPSRSVYFSFTPTSNWDTITTGTWKIWITYIDNSLL